MCLNQHFFNVLYFDYTCGYAFYSILQRVYNIYFFLYVLDRSDKRFPKKCVQSSVFSTQRYLNRMNCTFFPFLFLNVEFRRGGGLPKINSSFFFNHSYLILKYFVYMNLCLPLALHKPTQAQFSYWPRFSCLLIMYVSFHEPYLFTV